VVPPIGPVVIISATALAFIAAAIAYARGRDGLGSLLAFIGTLCYGNGIWLMARALHLNGHYPDAALWWAIGALVAGHLVKSRLIAIEAGLVAIVWVALETGLFRQPAYPFAGLGVGLLWLAYRTRSAAALTVAVVSSVVWIAAINVFVFSATPLLRGTVIVAAAAAVALILSLIFARRIFRPADTPRHVRPIAAALAGTTLVALLAGIVAIHAWPLWTGQLVYLRVRPVDSRDLLRGDHVSLSYPIDDVRIRVPGEPIDAIPPDPAGPPPSLLPPDVDPIGDWWKVDEEQARGWRDREIYLQLKPQPAGAPGVAEEHRPVSVSDRLVAGAVNLAGRIVFYTTFDYSFRLQFGLEAFPVDEAAGRLIAAAMQRDAPIYAEVAVSRSGRARLRALIVDGRRVD
jgi:uncharacterized membrane-anchored protein